jgi:argininosuccinate synthase
MSKDIAVLAYSGGLDTSVCIKWLMEHKGVDVIDLAGDVGQERADLDIIKQKALDSGAIESLVVDMREEFVNEYLAPAIQCNALYENKYPLVSALSRPVIVKHLVAAAQQYGAKYIAHGCTGKGNDQVRFEIGVTSLAPELGIFAPAREWEFKTREDEMEWAAEHGVPVPVSKASPYSIDDNLWGRAIECGVLEDPWTEPPSDIYTMTTNPEDAPAAPTYVEVGFKAGLPVSLDGKAMGLHELILAMNEIAGGNGFGRIDMVENRLVGVKSREVYEMPAACALIVAHKALEDMCLEREVLHYKLKIEQDWATAVYNGQWFSPVKRALEAFVMSTQAAVTGDVRLKFYKGSCTVVGRRSALSLYDYDLATYGSTDTFDREAAKGFIELSGLPTKVWAQQQRKL